jgi:hypothetical protein
MYKKMSWQLISSSSKCILKKREILIEIAEEQENIIPIVANICAIKG